jgi:hypothetical protein
VGNFRIRARSLDGFRESIWEKFKEEILGSLSIRNDEQVILNVPEDPSSEEFSLDRQIIFLYVMTLLIESQLI